MNKTKIRILAIETSCDDTCAAVLENDRVLSNVVSSQTDLHAKWGGVVPDIAKRAHQERIGAVIASAILRAKITTKSKPTPSPSLDKEGNDSGVEKIISIGMKVIDVITVTQGPGLAIALGVGVNYAKELAIKYGKKLVAVNHIEGHIMANLAKNKLGRPEIKIEYPALALTVSGGHTKIILLTQPRPATAGRPSLDKEGSTKFVYEVVGETLDDAAGEALDKAAKLLGLGYPGGPIIERLARLYRDADKVKHEEYLLKLPQPLADKKILDYSFSGLKTSFYYQIRDWPKGKIGNNLNNLAASFQEAVFDTLIRKFKLAIEKYQPKTLMAGGGVLANLELRKRLRKMAKEYKLPLLMPTKKILNTDNAAMIGVAGYYKAMRGEFVENIEELDRDPRLKINY